MTPRAKARSARTSRALRLLPGEPVHRCPEEVGMADVPRVLLDQVEQDPPQAGCPAVGPGAPGQLLQAAVGQRLRDREVPGDPARPGRSWAVSLGAEPASGLLGSSLTKPITVLFHVAGESRVPLPQSRASSSVAVRPACAVRRRKSASSWSSASPYSAQIWSIEVFIPE